MLRRIKAICKSKRQRYPSPRLPNHLKFRAESVYENAGQTMQSNLAEKITGMRLEIDNSELLHMLESPSPSAPRWMKLWQSCRLTMPRKSCPEGGHCCCCYLLDKKKSQKPNNPSWHPAKVWRPPSLSVDLHTEGQVANSIGHFVSEGQLWSTYNFSIIRINSLGSVETQMITFFLYCGFWFFPLIPEIGFDVPQ